MGGQVRGELEEYMDMQEGARAEDCTSKKIAKLIKENYPQDQAAAIAYSMCGESSRSSYFIDLDGAERWAIFNIEPVNTFDTYTEALARLEELNAASANVTPVAVEVSRSEDEQDDAAYADEQTRAVPEKYSGINFKPTETMANAAERALEWRAEYGRGGTEVGVARARDLKNRVNLSPETVRRMKAYFDRHESDKQGEGWSPGEDGYPSAGRIAWGLWGDDAGYAWSRQRVESMNAADEKERGAATVDEIPDSTTRSTMPVLASTRGVVTRRFVDRAVTALDAIQGVVRGYVAVWGDAEHRDSYSTFFDASRPPEMGIDNGMHRRPILYEHSQDGAIRIEIVGTITRIWRDETGIAYEGELDRSSPFFPRIVEELQRGELKTSSATMEHTAEFYPDGAFKTWILGELSLTKTPAESRMPNTTLIRSQAHEGDRVDPRAGDEPQVNVKIEIETQPEGEKEMTPEQKAMLDALIAEFGADAVMAAVQQAQQQPAPQEAMSATPQQPADMRSLLETVRATLTATQQNAEVVALRNRVAALEAANNAPPQTPDPTVRGARRPGDGVNVNMIEARKYARFSHDEMLTLAQILQSAGIQPTEGFTRSLAHRGFDMMQKSESPMIRAYAGVYTRADDFMATDIAGQGSEWVGTFYGDQVWEKARHQPIIDALRSKGMYEAEVPDGASSIYIPLESADATFYTTAQSNDKDATGNPETTVNVGYVGTANVQVTPGQLTGAVGYTDILTEDAVIAQGLVAQLNNQMNQAAIRLPEYVLINGDTATSANTNINLIDGTPATGINKPKYLVSDGALKLALVTNSAQARDGGTLDDADFLANMNLMDSDALANPDGMVHIVDPQTYQKALSMLTIKTLDVAGANASLFNGRVPPIYGVDVVRTGQMALANSAGKIPAAGGTLGRLLTVYAPYWAMIWKRRITFETARLPLAQTNVIICSLRMGFRARAATLSTSKAAAVSYNITV